MTKNMFNPDKYISVQFYSSQNAGKFINEQRQAILLGNNNNELAVNR